jgi:hypothetical protein
MPLTPIQESILESWLRKQQEPVVPRRLQTPGRHQKDKNPKWSDDAWFEKRFGDPDYYKRIRGLD